MKAGTRRFTALLCAFCMLFTSIPSSVMSDSLTEEIQVTTATPTDLQPVETEETVTSPETEDEAPRDEATEKPQADRELQAGDDLMTTGELTETKKEYLVRFTPERSQTMVLILTSDRELKATVHNESTGERETFVRDHADEDGTITRVVADYKTEKENTYLIRISAEESAEFTLRLVRKSVWEQEQETEDPTEDLPEETTEEPTEESAEKIAEEPAGEPAEEPTDEVGEESGKQLADEADVGADEATDVEPSEESVEQEITEEPVEELAETSAETRDGQSAGEMTGDLQENIETDRPKETETTGDENTGEPEPEKEKPAADWETTANGDVTVSGEMNSSGTTLIRFTPDTDQTLYLILTAEGAQATVTDEQTDNTKQFTPDSTVEAEKTVLTVPFYKTRAGNTYLIRLSGTGDFTVRLVRSSILKAEANREEEPAATEDLETESKEEPEEDDSQAEPAELTQDEPGETPDETDETEESPAEEPAGEPTETTDEPETEAVTDPGTAEAPEAVPEQDEEITPEIPEEQLPEETDETPATGTDLEPVEEKTPATQTDLEPVPEEPVEIRIDATDSDIEAYILFLSDAGIPEGTELQIRELTPEEQEAYQAQTAQALNAEDESYLRYTKYLEFTLVHDGWAIPLNAPAKVYVTLPDINEGADALQVVRFDNMTPVLLNSERTENTVSFETEGFDVFGIGNALVPVTDHETELVKVEVLSFSEDAPVNLAEAEAPEVIEGLEVLGTFTIEDNTEAVPETETQDGLFIKAELKEDAELDPMEGVALYSVDEDGNTEILMEQLTEDAKITELEATQVAVIKDTGYRHLTLTVNPDETTDDQIVTLDGMMPKGAEATIEEITEAHAAANGMEIADCSGADKISAEAGEVIETKELIEDAGTQPDVSPEQMDHTPEEMTEEEPLASAEEKTEEPKAKLIAAYDISIINGTEEYQPDAEHPIVVEIRDNRLVAGQNIELWHIKDDGTEEQVEEFVLTNGKIEFVSQGFSAYAIVDPQITPVIFGYEKLSSLDSLSEQGVYICDVRTDGKGFFLKNTTYNVNNSARTGIEKTKPQTATPPVGAVEYYFEKIDGTDNQFYIYCKNGSISLYVKGSNFSGDAGSLDLVQGKENATIFTISVTNDKKFTIKDTLTNKYWNMQGGDGGGGFAEYKTATQLYFYYRSGGTDTDPYELDGDTYGLMNWNGGVTGRAMMASSSNTGSLDALSLAVLSEQNNYQNHLFVPNNGEATMWTIKWLRNDLYNISTTVDGETKYLAIDTNGVSLSDSPCEIQVVPNKIDQDNVIILKSNSATVSYSGKVSTGFSVLGAEGIIGNENLYLVQPSALTDEYFLTYSAKKVGVCDVDDGDKIIIYTRVWNDSSKEYEFYAIDHDGHLVRCYETGDSIQWIDDRINSLLWDFTEYYYDPDADTKVPNGYYDFYNEYSHKYLAPQITNGQVLSDNKIGVLLQGRTNSAYYSNIMAWDSIYQKNAGIIANISGTDANNAIASCNTAMIQPADFYFAIMEDVSYDDEIDGTVPTIDNALFGIEMKIKDFASDSSGNGSTEMNRYLGGLTGSHKTGLLKTYLEDGDYPYTSNGYGSMAAFYSGAQPVNHLFIQSIYNSSGYFEYDSTQNFASLEGRTSGDFTVYKQIATSDWNDRPTLKHGQFFPFDQIRAGVFAEKYNPLNLYGTGAVFDNPNVGILPDSDPRKYEKLYAVNPDNPTQKPNYHFALEMKASFVQTPNGKDNWGHDIIYQFTGDDDFWLYVDGELILDLGGNHGALPGTVNFCTGEINQNGTRTTLRDRFYQNYKARGHSESEALEYVNSKFKKVETTDNQGNTKEYYVFKDYTIHTMRIFYMERGAGASNLHMRFNLASVQEGHVELSKEVDGIDDVDTFTASYPYQIWYIPNDDSNTEHLLDPSDPSVSVKYKDTNNELDFAQTFTVKGDGYEITYNNVYLLKKGDVVDIDLPDDTMKYRIVECGVNTDIYSSVIVNKPDGDDEQSEPVTDAFETGTCNTGSYPDDRKDYAVEYKTASERSRVAYLNTVDSSALRSFSITKKLYDVDGSTEIHNDSTTFEFRLYLDSEYSADLGTADTINYRVKDSQGRYCYWDVSEQKYKVLDGNITEYTNLSETQRKEISIPTSIHGSISNIPAYYTVEFRNVLVGTKFKVDEEKTPDGYSLQKYLINGTETDPVNHKIIEPEGTIGENEDPIITICNIKGYGLRMRKIWTDEDYVSDRDPTYFAVYLNDGTNLTLIDKSTDEINLSNYETIYQLPYKTSEIYWYLERLVEGTDFSQYEVREVMIDNPVVGVDGKVTSYDSITPIAGGAKLTLNATLKGSNSQSSEYTVTYKQGDIQTGTNVRRDIVTNSREGIKIKKTDIHNDSLANAEFTLKGPDGSLIGTYVSDEDGLVTTAYLVENQDYLLEEIKSPYNANNLYRGYFGLQSPITISIDSNKEIHVTSDEDEYLSIAGDTLTIQNRAYHFRTIKVDKDSGTPLPGAVFSLHKKKTVGTWTGYDYNPEPGYENLTSGADGIIPEVDTSLPPGSYELREKTAPGNYSQLASHIHFTISPLNVVTLDDKNRQDNVSVSEEVQSDGSVLFTLIVPNESDSTFAELKIQKRVTGDLGDYSKQFTFSLTSVGNSTTQNGNESEGSTYSWIKTSADGETTTSGDDLAVGGTFTLAHNESIKIYVPFNAEVVVTESNDNYSTTWQRDLQNAINGSTITATITESQKKATIIVTNNLNAVAPTGYSSRRTPWLLLLIFGFILLVGGMGLIRRKGSGNHPDDDGPAAVTIVPANTGPPGGTIIPPVSIQAKAVNTGQPATEDVLSIAEAEKHVMWRNSVWATESQSCGDQRRGYITPTPPKTKMPPCPRANMWGGDAE